MIGSRESNNCDEEDRHDIFKLVSWLYDNHPEVLDDDKLTEKIYKIVSEGEDDEDVTLED